MVRNYQHQTPIRSLCPCHILLLLNLLAGWLPTMAFLTRLVYLIIVLSIATDLLSLRDYLFSTGRRDGDATAVQSSPFIPGASARLLGLGGKAVGFISRVINSYTKSKNQKKADRKKAKAEAKKEGIAKKKEKSGMSLLHFLINYFPLFFIYSLIIECATCPGVSGNLILCAKSILHPAKIFGLLC